MVVNESRLGGAFLSCNAILILHFMKSKTSNPVAAATSIPAPHSRGDLGNGEKDSELLSSFWFYEAGYS